MIYKYHDISNICIMYKYIFIGLDIRQNVFLKKKSGHQEFVLLLKQFVATAV